MDFGEHAAVDGFTSDEGVDGGAVEEFGGGGGVCRICAHAGGIRNEDEATGGERCGDGAAGEVGVDVEFVGCRGGVGGDGADDGDVAGVAECGDDICAHGSDGADEAEFEPGLGGGEGCFEYAAAQ